MLKWSWPMPWPWFARPLCQARTSPGEGPVFPVECRGAFARRLLAESEPKRMMLLANLGDDRVKQCKWFQYVTGFGYYPGGTIGRVARVFMSLCIPLQTYAFAESNMQKTVCLQKTKGFTAETISHKKERQQAASRRSKQHVVLNPPYRAPIHDPPVRCVKKRILSQGRNFLRHSIFLRYQLCTLAFRFTLHVLMFQSQFSKKCLSFAGWNPNF